MKTLGTPKTLDEAISQALSCGPLSEIQERTYQVIRDFLAQRFNVSMLISENSEELELLFKSIIRRDK